MKYLQLIVLLLVLVFPFSNLSAQNISGFYPNKTLAFVLDDISKRYDIAFAYDSYALNTVQGSWEFENLSIAEVMSALIAKTDLEWKEVSETIVIYQKEKTENSDSLQRPLTKRPSSLFGEIRDKETNELLPFAVIITKNGKFITTSNADGKFVLGQSMLNDTLIIHYVGYERKVLTIDPEDLYIKIFLQQQNTSLPTITIESVKPTLVERSPFPALQTINPNNLNGIIGAGEPDIYRAVQMLPGVAGALESNNGLFVRGSNSDQTLITFDGFTLYQQDHFFGAFSAINTTAVKNMRIHKGTMEARFGGRAAGVLEIIGNEGSAKETNVQLDVGPLSVAGLIETTLDKEGKASAVIAGRRSFTNTVFSPTYRSMFNTVYNAAVNTQPDKSLQTFGNSNNPEFYFQDLNFKLTYRSSETDVVNFSFFTSKDKLYMQYADTSSFEVINLQDVNYTDESTKRNVGSGLRWVHRWRQNWESLTSVGFSRFSGDFFSMDSIQEIGFQDTTALFYSENATLDDFDARFEINKNGEQHLFQMGAQLNYLSTYNKLNYLGKSIPSRAQDGIVASLYAQDEFTMRETWTIKPGIRLNYFNVLKRIDAEPRLAINYNLKPNRIRLRASAGIVHQYIHRIREQSIYFNTPDYWQLSGNDSLPVLRSLQYAIGGVLNYKNWTIDIEGYLKENSGAFINSGIYNKTDSSRYQSNILTGDGKTYGIDVLVQHDWKKQHAWLSYSLIYSRNQFFFPEPQMVPEPYIRQHEAKFYYQFNSRRWGFSALWVFGTGKPYTPFLGTYTYDLPNGTSRTLPVFGDLNSGLLESYHRLDINAAYNFSVRKTQAKLQFSVFNVYNRKNVRDIQYIAVRENNNNDDYRVIERKVYMLPFLPSINLQLRF